MMDDPRFGTAWWAWWSNPLRGMHEDHKFCLPLTNAQLSTLDYFQLIQVRSVLGLPDTPDEQLSSKLELRCLALARLSQVSAHFLPLAVWSLDSSILHARAQDWEAYYGVTSPEQIREMVVLRNDLPRELYVWHDGFSAQLKQLMPRAIPLQERALLGLGIYLKSFYPAYYARWMLVLPIELTNTLGKMEGIPLDYFDCIDQLTNSSILGLCNEVLKGFQPGDLLADALGEVDDSAELNEMDLRALAGQKGAWNA